MFCYCFCYSHMNNTSVLWRCWFGGRKGIQPVKNQVVRYWHDCLSGAMCIWFAYGPADAAALLSLTPVKSRMVLSWKRRPLNECSSGSSRITHLWYCRWDVKFVANVQRSNLLRYSPLHFVMCWFVGSSCNASSCSYHVTGIRCLTVGPSWWLPQWSGTWYWTVFVIHCVPLKVSEMI